MGLEFDGTSYLDYVDCGADTSMENIWVGGGTAMGWFRVTTFNTYIDPIVTKSRNLTAFGLVVDGWMFGATGWDSWNSLWFDHSFASNKNNSWRTTIDSVSLNTWYHAAVTYDKGSYLNQPLIYLNGVSQTVTNTNSPGNKASDTDATYPCYLGASVESTPSGRQVINGKIADVRLYTRTLSVDEIFSIYVARGADTVLDGLVARWLLNGVPGTDPSGADSVVDVSQYANHGTPAGAPTWEDDQVQRRRRYTHV